MLANDQETTVDTIIAQMMEKRPLPMGMQEFEDWSDRILSGALLPTMTEDLEDAKDSQKAALAQMLLHLNPTQDHECDGYFIKALRKAAVNQIADAKFREIRERVKARIALKEEQQKTAEATAQPQEGVADGGEKA